MKTICALSTARLNAAIHVIRISGSDAFKIINKVLKKEVKEESFTIQRNIIIDNEEIIDDVLLNVFVAPRSYTGENTVEINCHGGVVIADRIISLLVKSGCELAQRGEYTQRALLNKKLDFTQVEAINNLVNAENKYAAKGAIGALAGGLHKTLNSIQHKLFMLLGQIEVNIDYPEFDDVPQIDDKQALAICNEVLTEISLLVNRSKSFLPVSQGIKVAIVGKPNVGKSTLLNLLSREEKAIVSDIPGTTRDVVESVINLDGITLKLLDTAGIRNTNDLIEKEGIKKSFSSIDKSDLILYLKENDDKEDLLTDIKNKPIIKIITKKDLITSKLIKDQIYISSKNEDIDSLIKSIKDIFLHKDFEDANLEVLQSQRQIDVLEFIKSKITNIIEELKNQIPLDLIAQDLEEANFKMNELLGKGTEYDFLDDLFKNFCVGK